MTKSHLTTCTHNSPVNLTNKKQVTGKEGLEKMNRGIK